MSFYRLNRALQSALAAATISISILTLSPPSAGQSPAEAKTNIPVSSIKFETLMNLIIVPVRLGESRELRCILDTGMVRGLFLLDPDLGKELEIEFASKIPLRGVGKKTKTADLAMGQTLHFAGHTFTNQMVISMTEKGNLAQLGGIDGVIGASVFFQYTVEMDFETSTLNLYEPENFEPKSAGEAIPLKLTATKPYIQAEVSIDGKISVPVKLVVDSGARVALEISTTTKNKLETPHDSMPAVVASGVGGDVPGVIGRSSALKLGNHKLNDIVTAFPDQQMGQANGTLGMGALRRFIVTFDYKNKLMYLRPAASFSKPFEYNMAGVRLGTRLDGNLSISSIAAKSPAIQAGLIEGDIILSVDGHALDAMKDKAARELFLQAGKTISLSILRAGKPMKFDVVLERLV